VQTSLLYDNLYGTLAARLAGVPRLVASRRYDPDGRQRGLAHRLNRVAWGFADAIVCNTARAARNAPLGLRARHVVITNGAAPASTLGRRAARARLGLEGDAVVVGTVGRVAPTKNPMLFAAVAAMVGRGRPDARWLWIGGGPLEEALRARAAALGLSGRLAVTGERPDAPALLEALDVFLLTSDREGMSNGVMEAMAASVPCVVTDAGGNAELVADMVTGFVRPTGDTAGLAERVERLLEDPALRARLGTAGAGRIAAEFTVEQMCSATERLYRRLLRATPSAEPARPPAWPVAS
jgi:glycosyltransferase involved in cell wall biosynthesis